MSGIDRQDGPGLAPTPTRWQPRLELHHRPRARARGTTHAPVWLLDLDNTLHDAVAHIMPRINRGMTEFIARELDLPQDEAARLRVQWWKRYGATLLGLAAHHPHIDLQRFLRESHAFPDMRQLVQRRGVLADVLRRLPGRRIVFTNAPRHYAHDVVRALGLWPHLDGLVSIEAMRFAGRWQPKPSVPSLARAIAKLRVRPHDCVLVEDSPENLAAARELGVRTVLVSGYSWRGRAARPRAGRAGRIDLQVRSALDLPRARIHPRSFP